MIPVSNFKTAFSNLFRLRDMPKSKFYITATVELKDKNGKVTSRFTKQLNSYVTALIDLLRAEMNYTNDTLTDTSNSTFSIGLGSNFWMKATAASTDDTFGILVGSGNTAVNIAQYALTTKILHGTTANKLSYGAVSIGACATIGTTRQFTIARTFTNSSGGDITVNEVALAITTFNSVGSAKLIMFERSLLTFTITNGTSGTVTYTISATV